MPRNTGYITNWLAVGLVAAGILGCSGDRHAPVQGRVTLDGQPLSEALVMLSPTRATDPGPFTGKTDADGRFVLGAADQPSGGVIPGEYTLMIATVMTDPNANELTPPPTKKEVVPAEWRNGSHRFAVPQGGTMDAEFAMKSR